MYAAYVVCLNPASWLLYIPIKVVLFLFNLRCRTAAALYRNLIRPTALLHEITVSTTYHVDILLYVDWRLLQSLSEVRVVFVRNVEKLKAASAQIRHLYAQIHSCDMRQRQHRCTTKQCPIYGPLYGLMGTGQFIVRQYVCEKLDLGFLWCEKVDLG